MSAELILRIGLGIMPLAFGIDQLRDFRPWQAFVPSSLTWTQWPSRNAFWTSHALINIALGLVLLSGFQTKIAALLAAIWLGIIALVTVSTDWRVALRDVALCLAAIALGLL